MVSIKMWSRITLTLCVILFFFTPGISFAQSTTAVIPYELSAGKMIIKMYLNESEESFIFDTGASKTSLSTDYCRSNNYVAIDSTLINDATSNTAYYKMTRIASLLTPDTIIRFTSIPTLIMPEPSPLRCLNVVGIIGSDILQNLICTIDSKNKTIILTTAEKLSTESLRYSNRFVSGSNMPIFTFFLNGVETTALFDTGSPSFMALRGKDFDTLKKLNAVKILKEGIGSKSVGLSGKLESINNFLVYFKDMRVGPAKFSNVIAETSNTPFTLLGTSFLSFAKVVIDYPRKLIYYLPHTNESMTPVYKTTNFGITVKERKLVVTHIWKNLEGVLSEGDLITHINGVETGNYDFCDLYTGLKEFKVPGKKMLTIRTKEGKSIDIEYLVENFQFK